MEKDKNWRVKYDCLMRAACNLEDASEYGVLEVNGVNLKAMAEDLYDCARTIEQKNCKKRKVW